MAVEQSYKSRLQGHAQNFRKGLLGVHFLPSSKTTECLDILLGTEVHRFPHPRFINAVGEMSK
jgi:hypothetical protein